MSFHEISIAVRAENRASYAFRAIAMDVVHLGYSFGLLDSQTGRIISGIMSAVHLITSLNAIIKTTTVTQTAHNIAVGSGAVAQTTLTGATLGSATAQGIFNAAVATGHGWLYSAVAAIGAKIMALTGLTAATGVATGATMAFNVALAFKVGLLTLGVGVIIATAAAMSILALQTRAATDAMRGYSSAAAGTVGYSRGIARAGEEESLLRQGVID